ncbi:MAG: hypothetical protein AAF682_11410 [Planctomycetota bacterium]
MNHRLAGFPRSLTPRQAPARLLAAGLVGLAAASSASAAAASDYPEVSIAGHELSLTFEPESGLHLLLRSTYHVQVSAQAEDAFDAYQVRDLFHYSGVSFLVAPHLAGRFESLETGPNYMSSFVGHLLREGHQVWGFDNRGTQLTAEDCADPAVQALVGTWGLEALVHDATLVRDLMDVSWLFPPGKVVLGGQSLGAITSLMTVNAHPGRYDGLFLNEGTIFSQQPAVAGDNQDLDDDGLEDNPGLADLNAGFLQSVMIPALGTCDLTTETLMKEVVPLAFSPAGLVIPRPELDLDDDPFNDGGEPLLDAIDAAFIAARGTPMNLREFVVFAFSVPGPNPSAPGIPGYTLLASDIVDLGGVPIGDLTSLGDLADPSKYVLVEADVDRVVADALAFGNLASRGLLVELQATLGNLGVNPLTDVNHVAGAGAFSGHALFVAAELGFGSSVADTAALFTGAASNTLLEFTGHGHADIRFSLDYVGDLIAPLLQLAEDVK